MTNDSDRDKLIEAAFAVVADDGWSAADADTIAARAGTEARQFQTRFAGPIDCLIAGLIAANESAFEAARDFEPEDTVREKLFELVMARLDRLKPWRDAIGRLRWAGFRDPMLGAALAWEVDRAVALMFDQAGVEDRGPVGALRRGAFITTVYAPILDTWIKDESADLSETMADLDKHLDRAERAARRLPFNPEGPTMPTAPMPGDPAPSAPATGEPDPAASL